MTKIGPRQPKDIETWGHRGASAHLPENTLASFQAAIEEGCDGIESDVHATSDGVVLMFHDPTLDRTTTGKGTIKSQPWNGVIEHVRTKKEPVQPIPLFEELVELLMKPQNRHVTLNIDCKVQNDPETLFPEMARIISKYENFETLLAPRLILGLWHPLFIRPSYVHLPKLRRYHIGFSPAIARQYFWEACEGFSMCFPVLMAREGQAFLKECWEAGKEVTVWTVNDEREMRTALSWGVKAVLTDKVGAFVELKNKVIADPSTLPLTGLGSWTFPWSHWRYYSFAHLWLARTQLDVLRTLAYQPGELARPDLEFSMVSDLPKESAGVDEAVETERERERGSIKVEGMGDGQVDVAPTVKAAA